MNIQTLNTTTTKHFSCEQISNLLERAVTLLLYSSLNATIQCYQSFKYMYILVPTISGVIKFRVPTATPAWSCATFSGCSPDSRWISLAVNGGYFCDLLSWRSFYERVGSRSFGSPAGSSIQSRIGISSLPNLLYYALVLSSRYSLYCCCRKNCWRSLYYWCFVALIYKHSILASATVEEFYSSYLKANQKRQALREDANDSHKTEYR